MKAVIIPAYEPDAELIKIAEKLASYDFTVIVVDDGSGEKYENIFSQTALYAKIITHEVNRGKGAALKTGMRYIKDNLPECKHFITCDADGQHRVEDVLRVAEKLSSGSRFVLTVRERQKGTHVPFRSKFGNSLSRFVYALLTNRYLSDNQSGLRGFTTEYIDWMLNVERDKYDYEMNVLYYAAKMGLKITTLPIEAIYIGNNESSHFSPVADTIRIYRSLFSLAGGTLIAFLVSEIIILLVSIFFGYWHLSATIGGAGAISFLTVTLLNKFVYFPNIQKYDYWANLAFTVISYFVYTLMCMVAGYAVPSMPLIIAFNIVYFTCLPLRYFMHKLIFIASLTKD